MTQAESKGITPPLSSTLWTSIRDSASVRPYAVARWCRKPLGRRLRGRDSQPHRPGLVPEHQPQFSGADAAPSG